MEAFLLVGLIIIIIMLNSQKNQLNSKFDSLQIDFENLGVELKRLETLIKGPEKSYVFPKKIDVATADPSPETIRQVIKDASEITEPVRQVVHPVPTTTPIEVLSATLEEKRSDIVYPIAEEIPELSFWEKYPDLERFIGENLINKIGIAILVLGVGFFLKYAIDQNWINEIGRTCIGLVTGGVLIAIAHKMRHSYRSFSSVLIGGGIAILYFAITIAYQQYHLFGQELAFVIMIGITAATVFLAISYDRIELAVFAILGGFGAPFMVSTGAGNYMVLFSYMLILNIGMLVLAYYKKWNLINQICFVLTILIYGGWLYKDIVDPAITTPKPFLGALIFATLFYFVFFLMNVINNIRGKVNFTAFEIGQLLSNTALYFTAGMLILTPMGEGIYRGTFTIFLAAVNFGFAFVLYKNNKVDPNLLWLLIGLVLTFVSLAAPIQLDGNYITLFWALEAVLLIWLANKSGLNFLRDASVLLIGLLIISLVMDWNNIYILAFTNPPQPTLFPVFNKGFITSVIAVGGITGYTILMKRYYLTENILLLKVSKYIVILTVAIILLVYISILQELNYQAKVHFAAARVIVLGCYNYIYAILLLYFVRNKRWEIQFVILLYAGSLTAFFPILFNKETIEIRNTYLVDSSISFVNFLAHYVLVVLLLALLYYVYKIFKDFFERMKLTDTFQWITIFVLVFVASAELDHLVVMINYGTKSSIDSIITANHKAGFAILWGICSFVLIYLGMKWKSKTIRIASLVLFGITLLKLFLFDIRGLSEGGKIAAFISLGVILLVISFMYQKLKAIILADELKLEAENDNTNAYNQL